MKHINKYIHEKYLIDTNYKDSEFKKISDDTYEYMGIKIIANDKEIKYFNNYSKTSFKQAIEILKIVIDNFENELQDYIFKLFYSGYAGFTLYYKEVIKENKIGYLMHNYENINPQANWTFDNICEISACNDLAQKIDNFMGPYGKMFKES